MIYTTKDFKQLSIKLQNYEAFLSLVRFFDDR